MGPRLAGIEGVRGLAALSVVIYHVWRFTQDGVPFSPLLQYFWLGVTAFFVLSGFLLYRPFAAATLAARPGPSLARYARSRFLRIVPAYYVALTVLLVTFERDLLAGPAWDWLKSYLFLQIYFPSTTPVIIGAAWTLCIEVTFYLVLPLAAAGLRHVAERGESVHARAWLQLALLAPLVAVGPLARVAVTQNGAIPNALPQYVDLFAIGMMLAVAIEWHGAASRPRLARVWPLATAACTLLVLATYVAHARTRPVEGDAALSMLFDTVMGATFAILLAAMLLANRPTLLLRVAGLRPITLLGVVSYGFYLWHEPLIHELQGGLPPSNALTFVPNVGVVAILALACAVASWFLVERTALRLKGGGRLRRPTRAATRPATADGAD